MRAVVVVLTLAVGLLFTAGAADAKKKKSSRSDDLELRESYKRGKKRSASDPVLRRYGKKAEYVAVSDYEARSKKRSRKADKAEKVAKISKISKASKKAKKPAKPIIEEEILVIEEDPPVAKKKPAKKLKPAADEITITEGW